MTRGFFLLAGKHVFILFLETDLPYLGSMMKFSEKLACKTLDPKVVVVIESVVTFGSHKETVKWNRKR